MRTRRYNMASVSLAVDRSIEGGTVTKPAFQVQPESDRLDLLRLQH